MDDLYDLFDRQDEEKAPVLSPYDKDEYRERKQTEREEAYRLIEGTTEKIQASGELFQSYLDVQARFDRYSVSNAILITAQKPDALGPLKSYDDWKAEGAYVNQGESSLSILEPGKEYQRADGSTGVNINVKKVFDVTQTNSQQRATPTVTRDERMLLKALISHKYAPCDMVPSDAIPENVNAIYRPEERTIYVRTGLDGPSIFRALAQELAHAHMDKGEGYVRNENNTAAYYASYILCKRFGVSTDLYLFNAVPSRYAKMEPKEFRAELGKIRDVAGEISRDMHRTLGIQDRSRKERSGEAR